MAEYSVEISKSAAKEIRDLPKPYLVKILKIIKSLATNPHPAGSIKLTSVEAYRVRVGPYRVVYQVENEKLVILIVRVGHRKEIYK